MDESRLSARGVLGASPLITSEFGGQPNSVLAATLHVALKAPAGKKRGRPCPAPSARTGAAQKRGHTKMRHGFDHEKTEGRSLPFSVHVYLTIDEFTQHPFLRLLFQAVHMARPAQWINGFIRGWMSFQQLRHRRFDLLAHCPVDFRQMRIQLLRQQQMGEGALLFIFQKRLPQHAILPDSGRYGRCQIRQQIISVHPVRQFHMQSSLRFVGQPNTFSGITGAKADQAALLQTMQVAANRRGGESHLCCKTAGGKSYGAVSPARQIQQIAVQKLRCWRKRRSRQQSITSQIVHFVLRS